MTFTLQSIRSFHIGGHNVSVQGRPTQSRRLAQNAAPRRVDPNGDYESGQMYVQLYTQQTPCCDLPVLLWHGGGMTGANWETTPDGRPGWLEHFLRAGFHVAVCDAMERGRASWNAFPDIYAEPPIFRSKEEGWDMFRFGARQDYAARTPFTSQRFPTQCLDQFAKQWVPRWAGHEHGTIQAYLALLQAVGPAIVVGHSQGGGFALQAAMLAPDLVRAVVALEPSGAPSTLPIPAQAPPHLVMWGDYIATHPVWHAYRQRVDQHCRALTGQGIALDIADLPAEGIPGNSHFLMMDDNSQALAERVIQWIAAHQSGTGRNAATAPVPLSSTSMESIP